jgi:hypothetical protein
MIQTGSQCASREARQMAVILDRIHKRKSRLLDFQTDETLE